MWLNLIVCTPFFWHTSLPTSLIFPFTPTSLSASPSHQTCFYAIATNFLASVVKSSVIFHLDWSDDLICASIEACLLYVCRQIFRGATGPFVAHFTQWNRRARPSIQKWPSIDYPMHIGQHCVLNFEPNHAWVDWQVYPQPELDRPVSTPT